MNKYILILLSFQFLLSCSSLKENVVYEDYKSYAINNAVNDFIDTERKLLKKDEVFYIQLIEETDIVIVSIVGTPNSVILTIEEDGSLNYNAFPTVILEKNDKLFCWHDEEKKMSDTIISTLNEYDFIDTIMLEVGIPKREVDDKKKGVNYFYCKNNFSKFKKVKTNIAVGYFKQPKMRCE